MHSRVVRGQAVPRFAQHSPERLEREETYIYALICRDESGPHYVKVGFTRSPEIRLNDLRNSGPIPSLEFRIVALTHEAHAPTVEYAIHRLFASRRSRGEWFRFNLERSEERASLNSGLSLASSEALGPWTIMDIREEPSRPVAIARKMSKREIKRRFMYGH